MAARASRPDATAPRGEKRPLAASHVGIFARFTLRSLAANRVRTAVTVVGIALATGLLAAVLSSVTSLQAAMLENAREASGVWQVEVYETTEDDVASVRASLGDHFDRLARRWDLGAAAFSAEDAGRLGDYLSVLSLPVEEPGTPHRGEGDSHPVLANPDVREGRLPEAPGEIALPLGMRGMGLTDGASNVAGVESGVRSEGPLEVGSTIELSVGRRFGLDFATDATKDLGAKDAVRTKGNSVSSQEEYDALGAAADEVTEELRDVDAPRTFTVVGFVSSSGIATSAAYVSPEEPGFACGELLSAWFSTTGYQGRNADVNIITDVSHGLGQLPADKTYDYEGYDGFWLNSQLLLQQGLYGGRYSLFSSLMQFAIVLAVVIMVAAVSLISNAFTISISERTRQFGLLSSLGASKRQIRRTVLVEAVVLGACGIPLGMCLGLAGTWVAFALTSEGWAAMVGTGSVALVVAPWALVLTVALATVTLVASALLPAVRASRISAVDAIRQAQDVRPNRRLAATFRRRHGAMADFAAGGKRPRGWAARIAGMPGFLARRTLRVSASKSRVAVASLAVSVTLLVTAGIVSDYLSLMGMVVDGYPTADVEVDVTSTDASGQRMTTEYLDGAEEFLPQLAGLKDVTSARFVVSQFLPMAQVDPATVRESEALERSAATYGAGLDRNGHSQAVVTLVDDVTWRELAQSLGLSDAVADPSSLGAVLLNVCDLRDEERYSMATPFDAERALGSSVDVFLSSSERSRRTDWYPTWNNSSDEWVAVHSSEGPERDSTVWPLEDMYAGTASVPIVGVTQDLPDWFPLGARSLTRSTPSIIVPLSAAMASALGPEVKAQASSVAYYLRVAEGASSAEVLENAMSLVGETGSLQMGGYSDLRTELSEARAVSFTMQVFLYCFAGITAAIAVANVFNTIASSMMLRTREFATLRSAGMGERAFRRMIFLECADLAVRGFALGFALSFAVDLALYLALYLAMSGSFVMDLSVPWAHLALAFAVVAAVLAASVAYAMRKTHAMNLVEALRADAL